jgi:hypothetical protein
MRLAFPLVPVLLRIAAALPAIIKEVSADVEAHRAHSSDGGAKLTGAEIAAIVGHIMARLGETVIPVVAKANGVEL